VRDQAPAPGAGLYQCHACRLLVVYLVTDQRGLEPLTLSSERGAACRSGDPSPACCDAGRISMKAKGPGPPWPRSLLYQYSTYSHIIVYHVSALAF
jgi:hypothetical protein